LTIKLLLLARPAVGGMAGHIEALCRCLDPDNFQITLAAPSPAGAPVGATAGAPVSLRAIPHIDVAIVDGLVPARDLAAIRQIRRLAHSGQWDLIHAHGLKTSLLAALTLGGFRLPGFTGRFSGCLSPSSGRRPPLVITLHNTLPQRSGIAGRALDFLLRWILRPAASIIVVSQAQAGEISRRRLASPDKVAVIPNGGFYKDTNRGDGERAAGAAAESEAAEPTSLRRELAGSGPSLPERLLIILTVVRLIRAKGIYDLLEVAALCRPGHNGDSRNGAGPGLLFVVVGTGPEEERWQQEIRERKLGKLVRFLGYRRDVPALMRAADLFLLPSHAEGLPLALLEAMAAGLPVVATAVGGVPELVTPGETGLLVPPHSPAALAGAINLLAADESLRKKLGRAGKEMVEREYGWETMAAKTAALYERVICSSSRSSSPFSPPR